MGSRGRCRTNRPVAGGVPVCPRNKDDRCSSSPSAAGSWRYSCLRWLPPRLSEDTSVGGHMREHSDTLREPFGVMQAALLGVVGLVPAFGLSLALGRYEDRRAATVTEANAIGTTYLRAQLIAEPARSHSLDLLRRYTDLAITQSHTRSRAVRGCAATTPLPKAVLQRRLWRLAGHAMAAAPLGALPASTSTVSTRRSTSPRLASRRSPPRSDRRARPRANRRRDRPRTPRDSTSPCSVAASCRTRSRGARDAAPPRHLRPRPTDPRPHNRALHSASGITRFDGASARGTSAVVCEASVRWHTVAPSTEPLTAAQPAWTDATWSTPSPWM